MMRTYTQRFNMYICTAVWDWALLKTILPSQALPLSESAKFSEIGIVQDQIQSQMIYSKLVYLKNSFNLHFAVNPHH